MTDPAYYGSCDGVAGLVGALAPAGFSDTTNPTDAMVILQLTVASTDIDSRLSAAGYVVPVIDDAALVTLNSVANRLVAAFVIESKAAGRDPKALSAGATWRQLAEQQLMRALVGQIAFAGVPKDPSHSLSIVPSVDTQPTAVPDSLGSDFASQWGFRVGH